ncbi:hypothetical protein FRB95_008052 [Tulasnella sp. JGI-2019a]|nr:hypothetical protein FRB95_008052 [Tulasnella sp. JGI-2019a]
MILKRLPFHPCDGLLSLFLLPSYMRLIILFSIIAAFSVLGLPIRHFNNAGSRSLSSFGCRDKTERGLTKLKKRGAQKIRKIGAFTKGPLIFGSLMGGVGVIGTKKLFKWAKVRYLYHVLKEDQRLNRTSTDPRGPSFDVPTSPQSMTSKFGEIYPGWIDPSRLPAKAIILDEKEAVTVTVTVTAESTGLATSANITGTGLAAAPQPITTAPVLDSDPAKLIVVEKERPASSVGTTIGGPELPNLTPNAAEAA